MELAKDEIVLGEPLPVRVTLRNVSDQVLYVSRSIDAFELLAGPEGEKLKDAGFTRKHRIAGVRPPVVLEEKQSHDISVTLFLSLDNAELTGDAQESLVFDKPGLYKVVVRYDIGDVVLEESSSIRVNAPQGEDAQAWDVYRDQGVLFYLHYKGVMPPQAVQILKLDLVETNRRIDDIVARFPETIYGRILQAQREAEKPLFPDPQAEFDRIMARLKSQRYDVDAICMANRALYDQEVRPRRLALINEAAAGRISWEQFYAEHGRLIEAFVKKHGSPMSEEKWNEVQQMKRDAGIDVPAQPDAESKP